MKFFLLALILLLPAGLTSSRPSPAWAQAPLMSAQLKPDEKGNCFHWYGCRGDSIGNTLIDSPARCATLGGRSWLGWDRKCYSFPAGPQSYFPENYEVRGLEPPPGRRR